MSKQDDSSTTVIQFVSQFAHWLLDQWLQLKPETSHLQAVRRINEAPGADSHDHNYGILSFTSAPAKSSIRVAKPCNTRLLLSALLIRV